jgi:multicomponent Na+:H+ antiporter subunit D
MTLTLNPGYVLLIAAIILLAAPRAVAGAVMTGAAIAAAAMMLAPGFGEHVTFAQLGLTVAPFRLDAQSQSFGLGLAIMTALLGLYGWRDAGRIERAAASALAGGGIAAVFAGDLVSFAAAMSVAGLAASVVALRGAAPGAKASGVRLLLWQASAGALAAAGIGLVWAQTGAVGFERLDLISPGGGLIAAAMLIQAGAIGAHVWVKDAAPRASGFGATALFSLATLPALYGLLRSFSGEPALVWIGAATMLIGIGYAAAVRAPMVALAYGLISQNGMVLAAIGVGAPLALAGASAYAFALTLGFGLAAMACGIGFSLARPHADAPVTVGLALLAAAAVFAMPGTVGFIGATLMLDAFSREPSAALFVLALAVFAAAAFHGGWRTPQAAVLADHPGAAATTPAYPALLAMVLAGFLIVAIGVSPEWLLGLVATVRIDHPIYLADTVIPQLQLACMAAALFGLIGNAKLTPPNDAAAVRDLDWLWRDLGPRLSALVSLGLAGLYGHAGQVWGVGAARLAVAGRRLAALLERRAVESWVAIMFGAGAAGLLVWAIIRLIGAGV